MCIRDSVEDDRGLLPLLYIAQILLIDLDGRFEWIDLAQLDDSALELEVTTKAGGESVGLTLDVYKRQL